MNKTTQDKLTETTEQSGEALAPLARSARSLRVALATHWGQENLAAKLRRRKTKTPETF